jgi:hypothetical protein
MKIKQLLMTSAIVFVLISMGTCTFRGCTRLVTNNFRITKTILLLPNQKLVTISWKGSYIWTLTRDMVPGEKAETYYFQETPYTWTAEEKVEIVEQLGENNAVHQTGESPEVQK